MDVSFVIPAFNEEKLIVPCIEAIKEAAFQYEKNGGAINFEIVVVDDGSTDATSVLATLHGARVITCEGHGITRARQAGFMAAHFPIGAFIDADNRIPPHGWIESLHDLVDDPECVAISGPVWFDQQGWFARFAASVFTWIQGVSHVYVGPTLQGGNYACKLGALFAVGGMPVATDFYGEDTITAKRLATAGTVKFSRKMWCNSSARRFNSQGYIKTSALYVLNYFSVHWFNRAVTKSHKDYREAP